MYVALCLLQRILTGDFRHDLNCKVLLIMAGWYPSQLTRHSSPAEMPSTGPGPKMHRLWPTQDSQTLPTGPWEWRAKPL